MKSAKQLTAVILALLIIPTTVMTASAVPPSDDRTIEPTEFKPVTIAMAEPSPTPIIEAIVEPMPEFSIDPRPNVSVPAPKVKAQPKATPRPNVPEPRSKWGKNDAARNAARAYARDRLNNETQYQCLLKLWNKESGWAWWKSNYQGSGAYGIPQALPGSKMKSAGADWRTNPYTQVRWGIGYVNRRYGDACGAWSFWKRNGWY